MLAFVFFVAVFNLAVGYVLGGGELPGFLTKIPFLSRKPKPEVFDVEDSLTKPATVIPSDSDTQSAPIPQLQVPAEVAEVLNTPVDEQEPEETSSQDEPQDESIAVDESEAQLVAEVESKVEIETDEESQLKGKKSPTAEDLLAGLSSLQVKLSEASEQLKDHQDNPEEFETCANMVQEVNHDYLMNAQSTVSKLNSLSENGDQLAGKVGNAVAKGAEEAQQISDKIDKLLDHPLDDEGRRSVAEHSTALTSTVALSCSEADSTIHSATTESSAGSGVESSANELLESIETAIDSISDNNSLFLAEAQLDPLNTSTPSEKVMSTITNDLSELIATVLDETQSYSCEGRRVMFLSGDSLDQAINRVEQLRQCYENTVYKDGNESITGTLTCTISEIKKGTNTSEIDAILEKSANEADSLGTNQTLHHDGAFATPVEPVTHDISPRVIEVT